MSTWTHSQKGLGIVVLGFGLVAALFAVTSSSTASEDPDNGKIRALQCVDTASQETVFEQDHINHAANEYDQWVLQVGDELVAYMQPTGVYCTLRESIMAQENATGKVD